MVDLIKEFKGPFEVEFVGDPVKRRIEIVGAIFLSDGQPAYLKGKDGTNYNWTTIISVKKVL